jgi:hypothetical protein
MIDPKKINSIEDVLSKLERDEKDSDIYRIEDREEISLDEYQELEEDPEDETLYDEDLSFDERWHPFD